MKTQEMYFSAYCLLVGVASVSLLAGCTDSDSSRESLSVMTGEAGTVVTESLADTIEAKKVAYADMVGQAAELTADEWLQEFELTERSGETVTSQQLLGQPYVATFFFTTCPSICVRQNDQMKLFQSRFPDAPIRFLSITCDPAVDTPEVLSEYAERFMADPERWLFLTGDFTYLKRIAGEMFYQPLTKPRHHVEKFLLVDAEGHFICDYDWHSGEELDLLEEEIRRLLKKQD